MMTKQKKYYKKNALRVIQNSGDMFSVENRVSKSDEEKENDVVELFIRTLQYFRNFNRIKTYEAPIIENPSEKQIMMLWKWFDEMLTEGRRR